MTDDAELKKQAWVLTNENNQLKGFNTQLESRLNEYIKWAEIAQQKLETGRLKIQQLEANNRELYGKVNQGTVSMSQNLLGENSELKMQLKDLQEQLVTINELFNPLVMTNLTLLNSSIRRQILLKFKQGSPENRIIALYVDDPDRTLSPDEVSREAGVDVSKARNVLRSLDNQDLIREIKSDHYKIIQAVGDTVISDHDIQRVSDEALNEHFMKQIQNISGSSNHAKILEKYQNELQRRGQSSFASKILELQGQLHMSRRSSDWIIEKLQEFTNEYDSQTTPSASHSPPSPIQPPFSSTQSSHYPSTTSSTLTSVNPVQNQSPSARVPVHVDTTAWEHMNASDILADSRAKIHVLKTPGDAVNLLVTLRDSLSSSLSGTLLYQINHTINELKKARELDVDTLDTTIFEWYEKSL